MWQFRTEDYEFHIATAYPQDATLAPLDQVHGSAVVERKSPDSTQVHQADGHWTRATGVWLGVRTADCVPVLAVVPGVAVAAIHAGWRSVHGRIMVELYRQWAAAGIELEQVQWFVGPHIHPVSFEVQSDVAGQFAAREFAPDVILRHADGRTSVDLLAVLQFDVQAGGYPRPHAIRSLVGDTVRDPALPSYRRQGVQAGRIYSSIRRLR